MSIRRIFIGIVMLSFYILEINSQIENISKNTISSSINGTVTDSLTSANIEYANIVLYSYKTSKIVDGTISGQNGKFKIENVPDGRYYILYSYIGYKTRKLDSIVITNNSLINLPSIQLSPNAEILKEVTVLGGKTAYEYNLDKKVINVDKNLASTGGTAADVLHSIPSVGINYDGNVSLRGSSNITVLVDGKPSSIQNLDQIPSAMIESIEIITNPSAKYNPDGMSGIINVLLKKKRNVGYDGMLLLSAGTGDKYNTSVSINYRKGKINLFASYEYREMRMLGNANFNRESHLNDTFSYLQQSQNFKRHRLFNNARTGIDYYINDKNSLSLSVFCYSNLFESDEKMNNSQLNNQYNLLKYFSRNTMRTNDNLEFDYSLNYKRTFERTMQELTMDIFYSTSDGDNDYEMSKQKFNLDLTPNNNVLPDFQNTFSKLKPILIVAQTDYVQPIGNSGKIESGYKFTLRQSDIDFSLVNFENSSNLWIRDIGLSNHFIYKEYIHAFYSMYSNNIGKLGYKGGVRIEQVYTSSDLIDNNINLKNNYFDVFPNLFLNYTLNSKNSLLLTYSRRITRPTLSSLNPSTNYSDPMNLSYGNPDLKPEYINSYELGHNFTLGKTNLTSTLFYRQISDVIGSVMTLSENNISNSTFKNYKSGSSYGSEFILTQQISKYWNLNTNYSLFNSEINDESINKIKSGVSWILKINSSIKVGLGIDIQILFNYLSPVISSQATDLTPFNSGGGIGRIKENYYTDFSIKKDVLQGKGSVSLRINDLFKTIKFDLTTNGYNYTADISRKRESRIFFIAFSYKINDFKIKKSKQINEKEPDEFH
jgi:outer membrane receptor protein involved in Fe transport